MSFRVAAGKSSTSCAFCSVLAKVGVGAMSGVVGVVLTQEK